MLNRFQKFWSEDRNLLILLIFLSIHIFVAIPLGQGSVIGKIVAFVFYLFVLIAGLKFIASNRIFTVILIIASISLVLVSTHMFSNAAWIAAVSSFSTIAYSSLLAWIVLSKTFSEGPITIYRIQGSIVGYLLFGLIFAQIYEFLFMLIGETAFRGLTTGDEKELLYFSLTTLTTTGYGDISPAIPLSRSIANVESFIGQLYPAILIARLVSMEFSDRAKKDV